MNPFLPLLTAALLALPAAQANEAHHSAAASASSAPAAATSTDGEVRKIDAASGKLTLKHGEIKNLDMPPMTMVFTVKDKALLQGLQVGTKVQFTAAQEGGKFVITHLKVQP